MIQNNNNKIILLFVILLSFTVCQIVAQDGYYNINGTYTMYQNQNGNCVVVPEDVCTPCSIGQTTYYYSLEVIFNPDFPIIINKYSDSQCSQSLSNNDIAHHIDCSPTSSACSIFYRLTEIDFAQLTISSEELMYVGLIPQYNNQEDIKLVANSKEVIANGTITGFQAYSNEILFRFINRISETRYNTTLGECNYDEICTSYPFTYSVSIISRETKIPSDKTFIVFDVLFFTITDTTEEYTINVRFSDEVFEPALEWVYDKGDEIPTSFPGVTFYNPPKTGDHLQQISELELIPQENGAYYYLKYTVDWYNTFPFVSNCTVRERRAEFNNDYIICNIPIRSVAFPDDFDTENILQTPNPDDMSFQLF